MNSDWLSESATFVDSMYAVKALTDFREIRQRTVELLRVCTHAESVVLLRSFDNSKFQPSAASPVDAWDGRFESEFMGQGVHSGEIFELQATAKEGRESQSRTRTFVVPVIDPEYRWVFVIRRRQPIHGERDFPDSLARLRPCLEEALRIAQLKESEAQSRTRFDAVLESLPQSAVYMDDTGSKSWLNRHAAELLGISPGETRHREISGAMVRLRSRAANASQIEAIEKELATDQKRTLSNWDWIFGTPTESVLRVSSIPVESGQERGRLWFFEDATFRNQADQELLHLNQSLDDSENRFRAFFENAGVGIAQLDSGGRLETVNPTFCSMLGYEQAEFSDRSLEEITYPEDRIIVRAMRTRLRLGEMQSASYDIRFMHRGGQIVWCNVRHSQVKPSGFSQGYELLIVKDISERKAAEAQLAEREAMVRELGDNLPNVAIYRAESNGPGACRLTFVSAGFEKLTGVSAADAMRDSSLVARLIHPEDVPVHQKTLEKAVRNREPFEIKMRLCLDGGVTRWLHVRSAPLEQATGEGTVWIGVITDVTEAKKLEEALRVNQERYRNIVEDQTELVSRLRPDGTFTFVNGNFCRFFGVSAEELVGHRWQPVVYDEDTPNVEAGLARISPGNPVVPITNRVYDAQGRIRWMEFVNRGFFDTAGNLLEIQSVGREATERNDAVIKVREAAEIMRLAIEAGEIGTWTWNFETDSIVLDERLNHWYVLPPEVRRGGVDLALWRSRLHPDDAARVEAAMAVCRSKGIPFVIEFRIKGAGISPRVIEARAVVDRDRFGKPVRMIGIQRDVTEQRRLEQELREARNAAELANQAKSEFLANMSHAIRTPAAAVIGYTDMLLDPAFPQAEWGEAIESIRRNGQHLLTILNDILDLSKVESGRLEFEKIRYSPVELLRELDSLLGVRAKERKIRLQLTQDSPVPPMVLIDPTRLRQVLINLIGNALKFTEPGRDVRVRLSAIPGPFKHQAELKVEIEDQGIGISQEQLSRLFMPFRQADSSTSRKYGGTGLGLYISHRLVESMGGSIEVESELERGSRFTVTIPAEIMAEDRQKPWITPGDAHTASPAAAEIDSKSSKSETARAQFRTGHVLLVEDSADNRRVILFSLKRLGVKDVTVAVDGVKALEAVRDHGEFDLILMDMQMPEMDGYEATRRLRARGYDGPIVALTAHSLPEATQKSIDSGCDAFLTKPVTLELLGETLGKFMK